ncbi:MAG: TolC family protein [Prevotella sp.]|nr:TolC family protein [Prevotella sp.]
MKRSIFLLTAGWLTLVSSTWAQKAWTLDDCISYALENNLSIKEAKISTQSAEEDVKGAKGALLPTLSASTNHSVGYTPWTSSSSEGGVSVDKAYYSGSYGLNARWTVWDGNKSTNTVKQNKLNREQSRLQEQITANTIQEQIAQLYIQILYLNEALKVSEQSLETSKKNEERGQQMQEVGKMSKADVAQLSAQRATDEYNIVEIRSNIAKYNLQLKQLLELDVHEAFSVATPDIPDEQVLAIIPSLDNVYEQAVAQRPEIKVEELQVESNELSIKMARAGYLPTLSLTGGVGTSTGSRSNDSFGSQLKTNFDMSAGVTLSIPIFDGRQTKTAVSKARLKQEIEKLEVIYAKDDLYRTVEEYWLDAETNQQKFRAAQTTELSEQHSFDLLQEQFQLGLKNIIELMTGKDKLLSAQQNKLQSKYQTLLAQQMLKFYSTGTLK